MAGALGLKGRVWRPGLPGEVPPEVYGGTADTGSGWVPAVTHVVPPGSPTES